MQEEKKNRNEYYKQWAKNNPEKRKAIVQRYLEKNREKNRHRWRFSRYGITEEEFLSLKERQDNLCAICFKEFNSSIETRKELDIDHCHQTGKIRGLLCNNCNRGIGHLQDSVEILNNAIKYLEKFNKEINE